MAPFRLSAVVICFNEEKNIERCLESLLPVADEILVVDSGSKDRTVLMAEALGARVLQHPFEGHIEQKNFAMQAAKYDMVLSLDADEALTPELQQSILQIKREAKCGPFSFNRLTYYCGHWVKHCGWYPDTKLRLWDRNQGTWGGENPHDRVIMQSGEKPQWLVGDLLHYSYYTKEDHLKQIEFFSSIASKELHKKGRKTNVFEIGLKVAAQFLKSFIVKKGFLDGSSGWTISKLSAYATYRKYTKLKALQSQRP